MSRWGRNVRTHPSFLLQTCTSQSHAVICLSASVRRTKTMCVTEREEKKKKVWHRTAPKVGPTQGAEVSLSREVTIPVPHSAFKTKLPLLPPPTRHLSENKQHGGFTASVWWWWWWGGVGLGTGGKERGVEGGPLVSEGVRYMKTKTQRHGLSLRGGSNRTVQAHNRGVCSEKASRGTSSMPAHTITFTVILPVFALSFINVPVGASTHFATFIFEQIFYSLSLGRQLCFEVVIHFNP